MVCSAGDPLLAPLVRRAPGVRVPGAADGAELAVRAVLGQQVSVAAARSVAATVVRRLGREVAHPAGEVGWVFPSPQALMEADPALLPMPRARAATIGALAAAVAEGSLVLDQGADREEARARLLELPGVGPWTAEYVAMRALADPDAFPATDLGVLRGVEALIRHSGASHGAPAARIAELAEAWRPWRAYAVQHLWRADA